MKLFVLIMLVCTLSASDSINPDRVENVENAIVMVGKLPDPSAYQQVQEFMNRASPEDIGKILIHIAIGAVRPARDVVEPMLKHRDPVVVDRALRAMTTIGITTVSQRETIEALLTHEQSTVSVQAAKCLSIGGDRRAVPALINILNKKPELANAALQALKQLSGTDFKLDQEAWKAWYQTDRMQVEERLITAAKKLDAENPKDRIAAIQALGNFRNERLEVIGLIKPMLKDAEPQVGLVAQQTLSRLAPDQYTMPTISEFAALHKAVIEPPAKSSLIGYLAAQGFFDTWFGLFVTAFTTICMLSLVIYMLRSPPVKNMTQRFKRVVVAGTARLVRPLTARIMRGTNRIASAVVKKRAQSLKEKSTHNSA